MRLNQIIGQERNKRLIRKELDAKGRRFRHVLLNGPGGLGKTTLARVIAEELGATLVRFVASSAWGASKIEHELLALPIDGYREGGIKGPNAPSYVVFVDECHLMKNFEAWYQPLETLEIVRESGGLAWLPDITFIFATSKLHKLPKLFRDRISLKLRVDPYNEGELAQLIRVHRPGFDMALASEVARRSRGNARLALDFAESVDIHGGLAYFEDAEIDDKGLTTLDREYLDLLRGSDRPMSIGTLSSRIGETVETLQDIVEPWLLTLGMIEIGSRGRTATGTERGPRRATPANWVEVEDPAQVRSRSKAKAKV